MKSEIKIQKKHWLKAVSYSETLINRGFDIEIGQSLFSIFVPCNEYNYLKTFYKNIID